MPETITSTPELNPIRPNMVDDNPYELRTEFYEGGEREIIFTPIEKRNSIKNFDDRIAFIVPNSSYLDVERRKAEANNESFEQDCVYIAVNPFTGNFKDNDVFLNSLSEDIGVDVERTVMPMTLVDANGSILNPVVTGEEKHDKKVDDMIAGKIPGNIGGWYGFRVTGEAQKLNNPLFAEYIGALIAREVGNPKDQLWLEDITRPQAETVMIADDEFNLAEQITDEHEVHDLDQIITEEMRSITEENGIRNRGIMKRIGKFVRGRAGVHIPNRHVYH